MAKTKGAAIFNTLYAESAGRARSGRTNANRWPLKPALFLLMLLSAGSTWGEDGPISPELQNELHEKSLGQPAPRALANWFKAEILPGLHLEGRTARAAMDDLGQLGFRCTLAPEQRNLVDASKPLLPFVICERLLTLENGKVYGGLRVHAFVSGWKGDGTSLATRYEQLTTAEVDETIVTGLPYGDDRGSAASKSESRALDRDLIIAIPGQPMSDVVKYAMTHEIRCQAITEAEDHRAALECAAFEPRPKCGHALIRIAVSEAKQSSQPLSIWSTDRVVEQQGPWICLNGWK
jgi:hypothetical protein